MLAVFGSLQALIHQFLDFTSDIFTTKDAQKRCKHIFTSDMCHQVCFFIFSTHPKSPCSHFGLLARSNLSRVSNNYNYLLMLLIVLLYDPRSPDPMFNIGLKTKLWLASDCQGKIGSGAEDCG
jgi:hypothetical protein